MQSARYDPEIETRKPDGTAMWRQMHISWRYFQLKSEHVVICFESFVRRSEDFGEGTSSQRPHVEEKEEGKPRAKNNELTQS